MLRCAGCSTAGRRACASPHAAARRARASCGHADHDDACDREHRDRQEDADDAADLLAGEQPEQHQQRWHRDAAAHQDRVQHIVLEQPVDDEEERQQPQVVEARQRGDDHREDGRGERSGDRDELEAAGDDREQQPVRHADDAEDDRIGERRRERQDQQRPHVAAEHQVEIVDQVPPERRMHAVRSPLQIALAHRRAVLDHQEREDRDQHDEQHVRGGQQQQVRHLTGDRYRSGSAAREVLAQKLDDAFAVGRQPVRQRNAVDHVRAADQLRQLFRQLRRLVDDRRRDQREQPADREQQQPEDDRGRCGVREPLRRMLPQTPDQRVQQVREEHREHEHEQRAADRIGRVDREHDERDGPRGACGAHVETQHLKVSPD